MHLKIDDKLGMNFTIDNADQFYLTEDKTKSFLAEISSGVTVPKKTSAIQVWKKQSLPKGGSGKTYEATMTFNDVLSLKEKRLTLARSKSHIFYTRTWA